MKTINYFKTALILMVFISFTMNASPVKKSLNDNNNIEASFESNAHMDCTGTSDGLYINYTNPNQEDLTFVVRSVSGETLEIEHSSEVSGQIFYSAEELIAKGGTGIYNVSLYSGHPSKKVETTSVVIIVE